MSPLLTTIVSPSHVGLLTGYLLPSVRGRLDILTRWLAEDADGEYGGEVFRETCRKKAEFLAEVAEAQAGRLVIYADADVQFFAGDLAAAAAEALGGHDIAFQDDGASGFCMGLLVFRATPEVALFFRRVAVLTPQHRHDQAAANALLADDEWRRFRNALPATWWTHGVQGGRWDGRAVLPERPAGIVAHHANWTLGLANKRALLAHYQ